MITSVSPTPAVSGVDNGSSEDSLMSRIPQKILGQDEFLQLLVAQLQNQDPLSPQSDSEFIGMMTQFTALEQTKSMQSDIAQMRSQQEMLQAMSMLDRKVMVVSEDGVTITGVVKGFNMDGQTPKLQIGDGQYDLSKIVNISLVNQNETQN